MVEILIATPDDAGRFDRLDPDVFDEAPDPALLRAFLADPRHHIALAVDRGDGMIVGMCSAIDHFHPDKPPSLFIMELGVATQVRRQGIATRLVATICAHGRTLGCREAWVVADPTPEAVGFYQSLDATQTGQNLAMFTFDLTA